MIPHNLVALSPANSIKPPNYRDQQDVMKHIAKAGSKCSLNPRVETVLGVNGAA